MIIKLSGIAILLSICTLAHAAPLRFSRHFSDHAVLQRDKPVTIRGQAAADAAVSVTLLGQTKQTRVDALGSWEVTLDPMPAMRQGGDLTAVSGDEKVTLSDIVVGDVVLFACQTSIDLSLGRTDAGKAIAAQLSRTPDLRVMGITTIPVETPHVDLDPDATDGWSVLDEGTALSMSEGAFYLGRDLLADIDAPVGIIDLNMGPNFTIGWMDRKAIAGSDDFYGTKTRTTGYGEWMEESLATFRAQKTKTRPDDVSPKQWVDADPLAHPLYPAAGYNAVLHPLRGLPLKAVLLQLGNDYAYIAYEKVRKEGDLFDRSKLASAWWTTYLYRKRAYRCSFEIIPRVPVLWRKYFDDRQLPIALVMPPSSLNGSYAMHHREIREAQRQTARDHSGVGLVLPGNAHIPFSGQPADQALLAERARAWMLSDVYERTDTAPCGPLYERMEVRYNKAQIFFRSGTAAGLQATRGALDTFEAAAIDAEWFPAKATIEGETIRLVSDKVNQIAYVRYNYRKQPDQGLTNADGLPAIPFRTGQHKFVDRPLNTETELPMEYTTPAESWDNDGVAIISGGGAKYDMGPGLLGPTGLQVQPFGPNMRVIKVLAGSPAAGKVQVGDLIYRVNGQLIEDDHLHMMGRAVALAESEAGEGRISFSLRRGNTLLDVDLQIEVLGTISSTTPYDCPKSDRLIANCEAYLAERGGTSTDYAGGGWLHTDVLLLLGAGTPEYQGLVRRFVYSKVAEAEKNGKTSGTWMGGAGAMLLAEYYLATGDRNVLPALKIYCDSMARDQCRPDSFEGLTEREFGGWRHNYPGGRNYGMMATIGFPNMIGWALAREAGVTVDTEAYAMGLRYFTDHQAEMGANEYSHSASMQLAPEPLEPEKMARGMMDSNNGVRGLAAIFYRLIDDTRIAHLNSMYCSYAYNTCNHGHASIFFNGMWTPIGASVQSKAAFTHFMRNHYWYQDLRRMHDHQYVAAVRSNGLGPMLALVVPRQRLRILGASESVFAVESSTTLKPALDAYFARDYAKAGKLAGEMLTLGELDSDARTQAEQLARAARELQESISADLAKVEALLKEGKLHEASLDLPQLKGVMQEGDARLNAIESALSAPDLTAAFRADKERYDARMKSLTSKRGRSMSTAVTDDTWQNLTTQEQVDKRHKADGVAQDGKATVWRGSVVECVSQAPEGWMKRDFDDSAWDTGMLPFSWHLNHSLIGRCEFDVKDKNAIDALRISLRAYRQQDIVIYINGHMVAKVNQCAANSNVFRAALTPQSLTHLRNGTNTLAFHTTNNWRWAVRSTPHAGGFGLVLQARMRD